MSWKVSRYTRGIYSPSSFHLSYFQIAQLVANSLSEAICRRLSESVGNPSKRVGIHQNPSENQKNYRNRNVCAHHDSASRYRVLSLSCEVSQVTRRSQECFEVSEIHRKVSECIGNLSKSCQNSSENRKLGQERQHTPGSRN